MKVSFEILELIKKYVNGTASDEERTSLEKMILEKPELQEEVDLARMLVNETEQVERERILDVIRQVESSNDENENENEKSSSSFFQNKKNWWIIIGLAALLIALLWWWNTQQESGEEKIYAFQEEAYIPPSNKGLTRSSSTTNNLKNAYLEFELKDYDKSLSWLTNFSDQDSAYLQVLALKGHNNYHLGKYQESIKDFEEVLSKREMNNYYAPNFDNVGWTKILALLSINKNNLENKKSEIRQALSDFLKNANPNDTYSKKATELQKLLD